MKVTPMIFNTEMVKALLDGRKTVTRRPVKVDYESGMSGPVVRGKNGEVSVLSFAPIAGLCPFGNVGDLIWVRETFCPDPDCDHDSWDDHELSFFEWNNCGCSAAFLPDALKTNEYCLFKAGGFPDLKWTPSIHMPRWASRLTLLVTDVRIETLGQLRKNKDQVIREGFENWPQFKHVWQSIYGLSHQNDYVWVVEFEVIHQNVDKVVSELGDVCQ
ncbi:hypothetical protein [Vibrio parahaemolyticus]|uniref:hypothetical protein n=1 Tax=Vibrio parahaemolyticus TaxID=670 RepID=UPI00146D167B|nr:hypothetical protein [Vibrio parahaemolyticus]MDF4554933.1 hypothetical protein [Vibrio parahaemolyticus]MDF5352778.1 hypothetical protein [Vibrio parahaemolyticus]MDF5368229.1 hypothetical protein [Vibrio parahaemolyticus]MDG2771211.1 hypothetical protein [Vibrio parahaemolyticus]MDG2826641.1 hypothetical protein [Vibrio parahaemolyticus]